MLVSAIMPTRDRRQYIPGAIQCFLSQTYPYKELVIVDDGDSIQDLIPDNPCIVYEWSHRSARIGCKRNLACASASGETICHWDDDDWSDPQRIEQQVKALETADLTGYHAMMFARDADKTAWLYEAPDDYALGTSFCYRRELWERKPFPDLSTGEDAAMLQDTRASIVPGIGMMVARLHRSNTSSCPTGTRWQPIPFEYLPEEYRSLT